MNESWRMEYHTYLWSRVYYLDKLRDQGLLTWEEYLRIDKLMRKHYHADEAEELLRKEKIEKELALSPAAEPEPTPDPIPEEIPKHIPVNLSLTDLARPHETNPSYMIQRWLRSHNTIEFLRLWEEKNNPAFNVQGYKLLKEKMELGSFTLTAKQWIEYTGAIGIQAKQGKGGGTFAHPDIAMDFQMWLKPELRLALVRWARENGNTMGGNNGEHGI